MAMPIGRFDDRRLKRGDDGDDFQFFVWEALLSGHFKSLARRYVRPHFARGKDGAIDHIGGDDRDRIVIECKFFGKNRAGEPHQDWKTVAERLGRNLRKLAIEPTNIPAIYSPWFREQGTGNTPEAQALATKMATAWVNFAKHAAAVKRFFRKALRSENHPRPRVMNVDRNPAYPKAIEELKRARELGRRCRCRPVRYLNNVVEQDHRAIKRRVRASQGFRSFESAWRTIQGIETVNMIRKGQIRWLPKHDILGQAAFVTGLFGAAIAA